MSSASPVDPGRKLTTALLTCGVLAPAAFVVPDIIAGLLYPGYSFTEQAPSELFAIGAPQVVSLSRSGASPAFFS